MFRLIRIHPTEAEGVAYYSFFVFLMSWCLVFAIRIQNVIRTHLNIKEAGKMAEVMTIFFSMKGQTIGPFMKIRNQEIGNTAMAASVFL
jgi:hypothetical protein